MSSSSVFLCKNLLIKINNKSVPKRALCIADATELEPAEAEVLLSSNHFLLLLLPSAAAAPLTAAAAGRIKQIEKMLLDRHSAAAVVFAKETKNTEVLMQRLQREAQENAPQGRTSLRPFFVAEAPHQHSWQPLRTVKGITLMSWLGGKTEKEGSAPPAVLFVAHHDAFAAVPHMATGVATSASGAIALMWLAKELKKIYKQNEFDFSVGFLMADASALNYEGISHWIGTTDPRILNAVKYVLCLDDLTSTSLTLHTPKNYKDAEAARFLRAIESALGAEGVSLNIHTRKISVGDRVLPFWPHEHFTRNKLIAGSLSAEKEIKHLWNRSSLTDNRLDAEALSQTIRGLAEGTARFLLKVENTENRLTHRNSENHLKAFINHWAKFAAEIPRFFAYRDVPGYARAPFTASKFIKFAAEEMESDGISTEKKEFELDMAGFSFSYEAPVTIQIAEARPAFFDWLLLLLAAAHSFAIYMLLKTLNHQEFMPPSCASTRTQTPSTDHQSPASDPPSFSPN